MNYREYLEKLNKEFNLATGENDFKSLFYWLNDKFEASKCVASIFNNLIDENEIKSYGLAELGTGKYNSVLPNLKLVYTGKMFLITPIDEIFNLDSDIKVYNGKITVVDGNTYIKYKNNKEYAKNPNCNPLYKDNIDTLLTSTYLNENDIIPYLNLINSNKTLFFTNYGSSYDKNKEQNIDNIYSIYSLMRDKINKKRNITFDILEENNNYAVALKVYSKK